jgi:hypothetical protein
MITIRQPAPLGATVDLMFPGGIAPRKVLSAAILQVSAHESYGFEVGGRLICAFGFWPIGMERRRRVLEFWLVIGAEAVPHLRGLTRLARLALQRLSQSEPVLVRALVRSGHAPGQRLARLAGLKQGRTVGGFERWEFKNGQSRARADGRGRFQAQGIDQARADAQRAAGQPRTPAAGRAVQRGPDRRPAEPGAQNPKGPARADR